MAVPGRVADGGIVTVVVALANGRDGAPEVVHVANLEAGDIGIRHREIQEREKPGTVPRIEVLARRHRPSDPVPGSGTLEPEPRYLRLLRRADRAHPSADALDLVEVARVGRARQGRGSRQPVLRRREQGERCDIAPPRQYRWRVPTRHIRIGNRRVRRRGVGMGPPLARAHPGRVGRVPRRAVVLAKRQHGGPCRASDADALVPARSIGDLGEGGGIRLLHESERCAFLRGRAETADDADEHRVSGRGHGGVGRRASIARPLEVVGVVPSIDRVQRVVRRSVHHGERAGGLDGDLAVRVDHVHRRLVPLNDRVARRLGESGARQDGHHGDEDGDTKHSSATCHGRSSLCAGQFLSPTLRGLTGSWLPSHARRPPATQRTRRT